MGRTERLGNFIQLRDVYGNTYTYAHLKKLATAYPVPKTRRVTKAQIARELKLPKRDAKPAAAASAGKQLVKSATQAVKDVAAGSVPKERLFANPNRPDGLQGRRRRAAAAGRPQPLQLHGPQHQGLRPQPRRRAPAPHEGRREGRRRHDPRPHRPDVEHGRAAHALRDPPGRPRRPADRPQADPRRLEAARVHRDLPRRRQEPVLRPRRQEPVDRPDPADEQGGAAAPRARQPAHRDLRVRPRATSAPASSTAACWPRSSSSPPPA